jgi:hypothetical protein
VALAPRRIIWSLFLDDGGALISGEKFLAAQKALIG